MKSNTASSDSCNTFPDEAPKAIISVTSHIAKFKEFVFPVVCACVRLLPRECSGVYTYNSA